jgi:hypothetical protein
MLERTFIPNSPACGLWETLLAEALDGLLKSADEAAFSAHMAVCPACAELFEEARRGREWLEFLASEPEVPSGLLDRILAKTGPGHEMGYELASGNGSVAAMRPVSIPAWQRPGFMGFVRRFAEPRLMMTAAMAFFSIALTLNLTGVRLSSLRLSDLRPSVARSFVERRLTMASTPIIRYYDHMRLVYEVQNRMRELRRSTEGEGGKQGEGEDNRQKQQNYAPGESQQQIPQHKDGGTRVDPPQQSVSPAVEPTFNDTDFFEASTTLQPRSFTPAAMTDRWALESAHSGGSSKERRERSTVWTA